MPRWGGHAAGRSVRTGARNTYDDQERHDSNHASQEPNGNAAHNELNRRGNWGRQEEPLHTITSGHAR